MARRSSAGADGPGDAAIDRASAPPARRPAPASAARASTPQIPPLFRWAAVSTQYAALPSGAAAARRVHPAPGREDLPVDRGPALFATAAAGGFILTVPVGAGQTFAAPATLNRYVDVGQALGRCFPAPEGPTWGSITLRVSFKRDGSVFGLPRISYSDTGTAEQKSDLAHSLLAGLKRCTPLPLSPSLGAAVAGEIFAIRFIHQDKR